MPLRLRWRGATCLPVEAGVIRPDLLSGLAPAEVARRPLRVGNASAELAELFEVEGTAEDGWVLVEGDLRGVARIGEGMTSGRIEVRGDVGRHLGAGMSGGRIEVHGAAGDWAGAEMRGGLLRVRGDAGDWLGAAYPGSRLGMREGAILVDGRAGDHVGVAARRGLIAVGGRMGDGAGRGMVAGSIFGFGGMGPGAGQGMRRGTIAAFEAPPDLLPTFAASGRHRVPVVRIYLNWLIEEGFAVPARAVEAMFERWNGDLAAGGQGEVLIGARD